MNRSQAFAVVRKWIETGEYQRSMFVSIIMDQNDWLGALGNKEAYVQATRLEVAQLALMTLSANLSMDGAGLCKVLLKQTSDPEAGPLFKLAVGDLIKALQV